MSDNIITPFGNGDTQPEQPYDPVEDQIKFATELNAVLRDHSKLPTTMVVGCLTMLVQDIHHNVLANQQQMQMAQEAMARVNAGRIKQSPN